MSAETPDYEMTPSHRFRDPRDRDVLLDVERWEHVADGHPELGHLQEEVLRVKSPTEIMPGRMSDEEWFYLEGA